MCLDVPDGETERCPGCWLTRIEDLDRGEYGQLVRDAIELEFALQAGVTVTLDEITADQICVLKLLAEERGKHDKEEAEREQRQRGQHPHTHGRN